MAGNWSSGVPTSGTNACIQLNGTYTVDVQGTQSVAALTLGGTTGHQTVSVTGTPSTSAHLAILPDSTIGTKGILNLTDTGSGYSWLDVQGVATLANAGVINVQPGTGTARYLYGAVANSGTLAISSVLTTDTGGHTVTNTGSVTIANGKAWNSVNSFTNTAGSLTTAGTGAFNLVSATFTQGGGSTSGNVTVYSGTLAYTGGGASTITALGTTSITGNTVAGQTLNVTGDCTHSVSHLYTSTSWTNGGIVNLSDVGGCAYPWLDEQGLAVLTNTGTINVQVGGGMPRYLYGDLANSGTLAIAATLTTDSGGHAITNTGSVTIANGTAWNVTAATYPQWDSRSGSSRAGRAPAPSARSPVRS